MQVNRYAELFGPFQYRPEELVVEIAAAIVAVDNRAGELLLTYAAVELLGGLVRHRGRQRRKAAEARRLPHDRVGDKVVRLSGKRDCIGRRHCSTPGAVSDTICMSMPAASISAMR